MYFRYLTFSCPGQTKFIHSTEKNKKNKKNKKRGMGVGSRGRGGGDGKGCRER